MELVDLFNCYSEDNIIKSYQDIMFICELPNGQLRGKLPMLHNIKGILDEAKKNKIKPVAPNTFKDYAMVCPKCGAVYSLDQYRCLDGYIIQDMGGGYTGATPCRDKKDSSVGPRLNKVKLDRMPKQFLKILN